MRLRLTGAVLVLLGLVAAGTAVASATLWRPADHIAAEALASGATTMIVTDPGVLELGDETVAVRATAPAGARVVAVVGRESDVRAWVGQDAYTRVTGLADAATLATTAGEPVVVPSPSPSASPSDDPSPSDDASPSGEASPSDDASPSGEATPSGESSPSGEASQDASADAEPGTTAGSPDGPTGTAAGAADPSTSDMWVARAEGVGAVELSWTHRPGRWALLVATTGEGAGQPTLELTWPREVVTPWFVPGLWVGGVLVLLGGALFVVAWRRGVEREPTWVDVESDARTEPVASTRSITEVAAVPELASAHGGEPAAVPPATVAPAAVAPTGDVPLTRRQLRELEAAQAAGRKGRAAVPTVRRGGGAPVEVGPGAETQSGRPPAPLSGAASAAPAPVPPAPVTTAPVTTAPVTAAPVTASPPAAADASAGPTASDRPAGDAPAEPFVPARPTEHAAPASPSSAPEAPVPAPVATPYVPTFAPPQRGGVVPHIPTTPAARPRPVPEPEPAAHVEPAAPSHVEPAPASAAQFAPPPGSAAQVEPAHVERAEPASSPFGAPGTPPGTSGEPAPRWAPTDAGTRSAAPSWHTLAPKGEPGAPVEPVGAAPAPGPHPEEPSDARRGPTGVRRLLRRKDHAREPLESAQLGPGGADTSPASATPQGDASVAAVAEPDAAPHAATPHAASTPPGTASADAWRARWGFVEMPTTPAQGGATAGEQSPSEPSDGEQPGGGR